MTVDDVYNEAAALLNDPNQGTYTDAKLLPMLLRAYEAMELEFAVLGHSLITEGDPGSGPGGAGVVFAAGGFIMSDIADMLFPIQIWEKPLGSTDPTAWELLEQVKFVEDRQPEEKLKTWTFQKGRVYFSGATSTRELRVRYKMQFPAVTSGATVLVLKNCKPFLAAKTAALAAMFIGENETRAGVLETEAQIALDKLTSIAVKQMQSTGAVRRRDVYSQIF